VPAIVWLSGKHSDPFDGTVLGMPSARRGNCSASLHGAIPKRQAVVAALKT